MSNLAIAPREEVSEDTSLKIPPDPAFMRGVQVKVFTPNYAELEYEPGVLPGNTHLYPTETWPPRIKE